MIADFSAVVNDVWEKAGDDLRREVETQLNLYLFLLVFVWKM